MTLLAQLLTIDPDDDLYYCRLQHHITNWPNFSGDPVYPIEGSFEIYIMSHDKWSDPHRHELLDFLLEQTK